MNEELFVKVQIDNLCYMLVRFSEGGKNLIGNGVFNCERIVVCLK